METIQVKDKKFAVSLPAEEIRRRVAEVAAQIDRDMAGKRPLLLVVLNGAFMFAADLMRGITEPCEEDIEGRSVVIVEDIVDSGLTMKSLVESLAARRPAEIRIASLLVKPGNLKADLDIPYRCFDIPNDFIVGYGLDYDGFGRNLSDIYTVVE